jgi:ribosomal protein L11 methyltransferase
MKYISCKISTTTDAEGLIAYLLDDRLGIDSVEFIDNVPVDDSEKEGGFFEELQPDLAADDGSAIVQFYLDENVDISSIKKGVAEIFDELNQNNPGFPVGSGELEISVSDDSDWKDKWKEYFHAFVIGDLLIRPSWESREESLLNIGKSSHDINHEIVIDPGMAFGTGSHESTRLVIEAMQKYLREGDEILDVGTGSGILSIAALLYGAEKTDGTDIDEDAVKTAYENVKENGLEGKADFFAGDIGTDEALRNKLSFGHYNIVFANILADIIIDMKDALYEATAPGGLLITSGIIDFKEKEVLDTLLSVGFRHVETNHDGEWVSIIFEK